MSSTAKNCPPPRLATAISIRSATTRRASPSGMSPVLATSISTPSVLPFQLGGDGRLQVPPDLRQAHPVQDLLEEAGHDEPLGLLEGDAPALQVEQLVVVDGSDAGGVAAPHRVVRQDLQVGDGVCLGLLGE